MALHLTWVFGFGLLGNFISCLVCLAPLPTFYRICKKKTSQGFHSIPYVIALFSAMLWLFYALFKEDALLLITINSFTFFMEIGYIFMYLLYATKKDKILTFKLLLLFNVFGFGLICVLTRFLTQRQKRVQVLGWICMTFSLCVFVAPLFIVRKVIRTKSVEFMPFSLSFFLTLSAVMWFFYGFLKKDQFVAVPNILGLLFGILQMVLYMIYRNSKKVVVVEPKLKLDISEHVVDLEKLGAAICSEIAIGIPKLMNDGGDGIIEDQNAKEQTKKIMKAMDVTNKL
ncbi:hypothetical protein POPTR_015G101600v4 [Populus trichocarpa]|uniref:Uncharacterized protein n=1 Tax=Populus trichocarpa TaxID=3694 RepID=A0ACC0RVS6_POPTR|nr:bidirectional sugar transporter SWEET10 [Populus trichocarpa]KAI9381391.1 hypothetical protein POPTR_015G101600v4 [Populus trichocarpa]